jgi:drug/metabolite transporter (DMT)-like permease
LSPFLLGALAGMSFGGLTVAVRWATRRGADAEIGAFAATALAAVALAAAAVPSAVAGGIDTGTVAPFLALGLIAPGASQIALTSAVAHAGPS